MFAAVDLGSNSFRLHIGTYDGQTMRIIRSARDPVRLGAGLDGEDNLTQEAMSRALAALNGFRELLGGYTLDAVRVVATNTLRIARNAQDFLPAAEQAIGHPIEIISGEEEGRLIYMGVASAAASSERRLVVDIGGGSTEFILGKASAIARVESYSIGTVQHGQRYFPEGRIDRRAFEAAILSARSYFEDGAAQFHPRYWSKAYGTSGTMRAIGEAISRNGLGSGRLSLQSLRTLQDVFIRHGRMSRINLPGIRPERVPAVVGGLAILIALMEELEIGEMQVMEAGLRLGVLWDLQLRATRHDRREQSVREFLQRFRADDDRAGQVADTACALYAQLKPASGAYDRYLYWSGLLHEVGMVVSHTGYHKHGAYLVANADLPGCTSRDQRTMSLLVLAQKGNLRKVADALGDPDFAKAVLALRLAVMFMHSRIEVDLREIRLKMKNRIELEVPAGWSGRHASAAYWLEKEQEQWKAAGVEFVFRVR